MRIGIAGLMTAVLLVAGLSGCTVTATLVEDEIIEQRLDTLRGPRVSVETFNGRISVVTGSDTSIDIRVVKRGSGTSQADAERDLAMVEHTITQEPGRVTITVRRLDRPLTLGNSGADVELAVPLDAALELRTSNGRIESANVTGSILARTSNGGVTIRDGDDVDAETSNGPLSVSAAGGRLELRTSNGSLDVIAAEEALVSAETSNGAISFSGSLAAGDHAFRTSNAALSISMPTDSEFTMDGHTSNASVSSSFPLAVAQDALTGSVGEEPDVRISAVTSNGDLTVTGQP